MRLLSGRPELPPPAEGSMLAWWVPAAPLEVLSLLAFLLGLLSLAVATYGWTQLGPTRLRRRQLRIAPLQPRVAAPRHAPVANGRYPAAGQCVPDRGVPGHRGDRLAGHPDVRDLRATRPDPCDRHTAPRGVHQGRRADPHRLAVVATARPGAGGDRPRPARNGDGSGADDPRGRASSASDRES